MTRIGLNLKVKCLATMFPPSKFDSDKFCTSYFRKLKKIVKIQSVVLKKSVNTTSINMIHDLTNCAFFIFPTKKGG